MQKYEITIIQAKEESIAISGFRYLMTIKHPVSKKLRCIATSSLVELADYFGGALKFDNWAEIEGALIKSGAWKIDKELEQPDANHIFNP